MGIKKDIKKYTDSVVEQLEHIINTASKGEGEQQNDWAKIVRTYEIIAIEAERKKELIANNSQTNKTGALPIEVRRILRAFKKKIKLELEEKYAEVEALNDISKAIDLEQKLDKVKNLLEKVEEEYIIKYIRKVKPPITTNSIFANAMKTTKVFEKEAANAKTKKCNTCGAGRPAGTDLSTCDYCGGSFF